MREHAERRGFRDRRNKLACVCHLLKPMQILCTLCALRVSSESASGREVFFFACRAIAFRSDGGCFRDYCFAFSVI